METTREIELNLYSYETILLFSLISITLVFFCKKYYHHLKYYEVTYDLDKSENVVYQLLKKGYLLQLLQLVLPVSVEYSNDKKYYSSLRKVTMIYLISLLLTIAYFMFLFSVH